MSVSRVSSLMPAAPSSPRADSPSAPIVTLAIRADQPLWLLPLLAGLLPAIGAFVAMLLFAHDRGVFCNPFVDDCVSISRMAKHGLANPLFRALVLPGAVLQALTWLIAARSFAAAGIAPGGARALRVFGVVAGITLVVYGSFLGTDGAVYAWLRRWGPLLYFGATYVAMLVFARASRQLYVVRGLDPPLRRYRALTVLLAFVAVVCLCHVFASVGPYPGLEDRVENLSEWWGALAMTVAFGLIASLWRHWMVAATITLRPKADA